MNDNPEKEIIKKLETIFSNINQWLNFAEAKNAALTIFNITLVGFFIQSKDLLSAIFGLIIFTLIVSSTIITLVSYIPNIGIKLHNFLSEIGIIEKTNSENLLYFEEISFYDTKVYLKNLRKRYFNLDFPSSFDSYIEQQLDYVEEIIINAKIATVKYFLFKKALILSIIALICILFYYYKI